MYYYIQSNLEKQKETIKRSGQQERLKKFKFNYNISVGYITKKVIGTRLRFFFKFFKFNREITIIVSFIMYLSF